MCLCVRHHEFCHYAQRSVQPKVPMASAQSGKHLKYGVFSKNALYRRRAYTARVTVFGLCVCLCVC